MDAPDRSRYDSSTAPATRPSTSFRSSLFPKSAYAWFVTNGTTLSSVTVSPVFPTSTGPVTPISAFSANGSATMIPSSGCPVPWRYASQIALASSGKSGLMLMFSQNVSASWRKESKLLEYSAEGEGTWLTPGCGTDCIRPEIREAQTAPVDREDRVRADQTTGPAELGRVRGADEVVAGTVGSQEGG